MIGRPWRTGLRRRVQIVTGQYAGIAALVVISVIAALGLTIISTNGSACSAWFPSPWASGA